MSGLKGRLEETVQKSSDEKQSSEKALVDQISSLKEEVSSKTEEIVKLEEKIENFVVDKMDSLKTQKEHLEDEFKVELKKTIDEKQKYIDTIEKKMNAKVEEKDFEFSSKVKVMMKEFHTQLANKEKEIQEAVQDAIEIAQKDERKIVHEYEEQINELQ